MGSEVGGFYRGKKTRFKRVVLACYWNLQSDGHWPATARFFSRWAPFLVVEETNLTTSVVLRVYDLMIRRCREVHDHIIHGKTSEVRKQIRHRAVVIYWGIRTTSCENDRVVSYIYLYFIILCECTCMDRCWQAKSRKARRTNMRNVVKHGSEKSILKK